MIDMTSVGFILSISFIFSVLFNTIAPDFILWVSRFRPYYKNQLQDNIRELFLQPVEDLFDLEELNKATYTEFVTSSVIPFFLEESQNE